MRTEKQKINMMHKEIETLLSKMDKGMFKAEFQPHPQVFITKWFKTLEEAKQWVRNRLHKCPNPLYASISDGAKELYEEKGDAWGNIWDYPNDGFGDYLHEQAIIRGDYDDVN